jgi:hypothetical protein
MSQALLSARSGSTLEALSAPKGQDSGRQHERDREARRQRRRSRLAGGASRFRACRRGGRQDQCAAEMGGRLEEP